MKRYKNSIGILLALTVASCNQPVSDSSANTTTQDTVEQQGNWKPLFNHQNLEGWQVLPGGTWTVEDGIIIGKSPLDEPLHGILLSDRTYDDFKLKAVYKAIKGNSGVYFRVEKVEGTNSVNGLQAEVDPDKDAGGLYDTGGRNWVVQPTPEDVKKWYKPNEWNEMEIVCKGRDVSVFVNGFKTADLKNDPGRVSGYIGLQLHGGMDMEVRFKDILIAEN